MQVILNYKSYYDAFKLGVVNNGFKPVAEVLFYPLFHPHTLCDGNGTPYEVDAGNASHWGNGQDLIPKEIQDAASTKESPAAYIKYFDEKVITIELSDALKDEMYLSMDCFWCEVVNGDLVLKEHEAARWLTMAQLNDVEWLPADITLIEKIRKAFV